MKSCKAKLCSFFRFLLIIFSSLFLSAILTILLHSSKSLSTIENFLISKTNNVAGMALTLLTVGFSLSIVLFVLMYTFVRLFNNQNKLLSNDAKTHEYLLQFAEVRHLALKKLDEKLQDLYLQEGRNKQKKISNKLVLKQIHEINEQIDDLRNRSIE